MQRSLRSVPPDALALTLLSAGIAAATLVATNEVTAWFDEAYTFVAVQDGIFGVFGHLSRDPNPPLYFLITASFVRMFGIEEWVLRLPSAIAAVLAVPLLYRVTRRLAGREAAQCAALLLAVSPLLNHYAYEARGYSLLVLVTLWVVDTYLGVWQEPQRPVRWALFGVSAIALLQTHNYGVFLLPPLALAPLYGAEPRKSWNFIAGILVVEIVAFATYLPWFAVALSTDGATRWLAGYWTGSERFYKPIESILGFGPFAGYHAGYLRHLHDVPYSAIANAAATMILLLPTLRSPQPNSACEIPELRPAPFLWGVMLLPLAIAWAYSWTRRPIYLVGRYDLISLGPCFALFGIGAAAIIVKWRMIGIAFVAALIVSGGIRIADAIDNAREEANRSDHCRDVIARIRNAGGTNDILICVGYGWTEAEYARQRMLPTLETIPYPKQIKQYPGWWNPEIYLRDRSRLERESHEIVERVSREMQSGRKVWLWQSVGSPVEEILYAEIRRMFGVDGAGLIQLAPARGGMQNDER